MTPPGLSLLSALLPEIILIGGAFVVLFTGMGATRRDSHRAFWLALGFTALATWFAWYPTAATADLSSWIARDTLVDYARLLTLGMGYLILLTARHVPEPHERAEFFCLILVSLSGVMLTAQANDLIFLFLALEVVSVPTYILIGLSRRDVQAQEATGKYFFLGAFAAAITLYGLSFLYGATGTTTLFGDADRPGIAAALSFAAAIHSPLLILGFLLTLAGLAFKLAAVPLHFYVADVYQGAAAPVTGMLGFVPKFAGFLAVVRLLSLIHWNSDGGLFWLLWAMAVATMLVGNTLALMQSNVKRMLAYSSVAHSGYMLVALVAENGDGRGIAAMLFYMSVYAVMNLGAFAALSFFRKRTDDEEDSAQTLEDLAGSARRHPWAALALAICVVGLMGLPPTGGFFAKLHVFSAALARGTESAQGAALLWLVVIGVVNAAIGAAYYLRIVASCYLRPPGEAASKVFASRCPELHLALAACAVFVLTVFWRPAWVSERTREAVAGIRAAPQAASDLPVTVQQSAANSPPRPPVAGEP
jgi:NADH-quinone oxidoreductase subunit N